MKNIKLPLTKKQVLVYEFVERFIKENKYAPTLKEIGLYFGFSISCAQAFVRELVNKNWLYKQPDKKSGLSLREIQ